MNSGRLQFHPHGIPQALMSNKLHSPPQQSGTLPPSMQAHRLSLLKAQGKRLADAWYSLQLTYYGGRYSIERMLSLEEYTRTTSLLRVVLVSIGAPLVICLLVTGLESVPLQDPTDGWRTNYGFWVRVGSLGAVIGYAGGCQLGMWLDVPDLSSQQLLIFTTSMALGVVAVGMAAAELWVFPVPFFTLSLSITWPLLLVGFTRVTVGAPAFKKICSRRDQLRRVNKIGVLQSFLCAAYPAYQVLFIAVNHTRYEVPVVLFLSIFKLVMKTLLAKATSHREDIVPAEVMFTADFFDAFYLATFMPMLSWRTLAALLVIHYLQSAIELRDLHQRTQRISARFHEVSGLSNRDTKEDLLSTLRSACYSSEPLRKRLRTETRVYSSILHHLSPEGRILLGKFGPPNPAAISHPANLNRVLPGLSESAAIPRRVLTCGGIKTGSRTVRIVQPIQIIPTATGSTGSLLQRKSSFKDTSAIFQEALEVLFTAECLVLIEYMEIVIPSLYAIYVLVMVHLPSALYHIEMAGITHENVGGIVSRMFIYALVEFISFVLLAVITRRNCGLRALYQLGFGLETQMTYILSKLMLWIMLTLTYRIVHFGDDFSFQFEWMAHTTNGDYSD